jgi:[protein-PII] uridylyltransferase
VAIQEELSGRLGWHESRFARLTWHLPDSYWLSEPPEVLELNARFVDAADREPLKVGPISVGVQEERGATLLTVYAKDQPGLFYRLTGAISLAGASVIDARIHTSSDGMALDNFLLQDAAGKPFGEAHQLERLEKLVRDALAGQEPMTDRLEAKGLPLARAEAFHIRPAVFIDPAASNRYTVVEVNARDRAALLSGLARAIFESRATVQSAHIATYGERAVDVFYLADAKGEKIENPAKLKALRSRLLSAASEPETVTA